VYTASIEGHVNTAATQGHVDTASIDGHVNTAATGRGRGYNNYLRAGEYRDPSRARECSDS